MNERITSATLSTNGKEVLLVSGGNVDLTIREMNGAGWPRIQDSMADFIRDLFANNAEFSVKALSAHYQQAAVEVFKDNSLDVLAKMDEADEIQSHRIASRAQEIAEDYVWSVKE